MTHDEMDEIRRHFDVVAESLVPFRLLFLFGARSSRPHPRGEPHGARRQGGSARGRSPRL